MARSRRHTSVLCHPGKVRLYIALNGYGEVVGRKFKHEIELCSAHAAVCFHVARKAKQRCIDAAV